MEVVLHPDDVHGGPYASRSPARAVAANTDGLDDGVHGLPHMKREGAGRGEASDGCLCHPKAGGDGFRRPAPDGLCEDGPDGLPATRAPVEDVLPHAERSGDIPAIWRCLSGDKPACCLGAARVFGAGIGERSGLSWWADEQRPKPAATAPPLCGVAELHPARP